MYFLSDMRGGFGVADIWLAKMRHNGRFGGQGYNLRLLVYDLGTKKPVENADIGFGIVKYKTESTGIIEFFGCLKM